MNFLQAYAKFLNAMTKVLKVFLIALLSAMVLIMLFQCVMRYVFSNAQPWAEELTLYISTLEIMLGLGIATRRDSHLQVDFLTNFYGPKLKCFMSALMSFIGVIIMIIFFRYSMSLIAIATGKSVTMPLTMKQIYMIFPLGATIVILYSVEVIGKNVYGFFHDGKVPELGGKNA